MLYVSNVFWLYVLYTSAHVHTNFNAMYRVNPITWAGQEVLLLPVGQEDELSNSAIDIFQGLYSGDIDADVESTFL